MFLGKEVRVFMKGQARDSFIDLKNRNDKESKSLIKSIERLIEATKEVLEMTPPEILSDIMHRGIYLAGGGALIKGLPEIIAEYTKISVHIAPDPLTAVCRGTGIILENLELYKDVLIANEDELPPKK